MSKIFLIPPEVLQTLNDSPPPPHLIIKAAELVSVFEAETDHPLGSLKVNTRNLRGILIVVRVKLQNSHLFSISFAQLTRNLEDNFPSYLHYSFAMENRLLWQQRDISISQLPEGVAGPDLV